MPDTLATSYLPEIDAAFPVMLNDRWRVVDDPLQWVLQYRARMRGRSDGTDDPRSWEGRHYCRTSAALKRCIRECCGEVDPVALAIIDTSAEWHI